MVGVDTPLPLISESLFYSSEMLTVFSSSNPIYSMPLILSVKCFVTGDLLLLSSDQCETEIGLRAAIKHVVKFDLQQENLTGSVGLPQADCLVFWCILETISKDFEEFVGNFRKFSKLLKPGGCIMYYGGLNCTFFMVGGEKFNVCKYNESDFRSMLSNEGFVITHLEVSQRKAESDLLDFDSVMFCTAYKK